MGELTEMKVTMGPDAWRKAADSAVTEAVSLLAGGTSADRIIKAWQCLQAADTFNGRANMSELLDRDDDVAVVEAWDLTDEGLPGEVVPAQ